MVGPDNRQGLLLTDDKVLEIQTVHAAMDRFGLPRNTSVATASSSSSLSGLPKATFDTVVSLSSAPGHHDVPFLGLLLSTLRAGGKLTIEERSVLSESRQSGLEKSLLLSGFTQIATQPPSSLLGESASLTAVSAAKPEWEAGAKAAVSKLAGRRREQQPAVRAAPLAAASAWLLAPDEDEELVDEEELLTEADRARPVVPTVGECEAGAAKKACANCTCGRAEEEEAGVRATLTQDMLDDPQSACGSCGLGDAFRCSTCPYRGLPKFEMGEKVQLPSDFLTADA